MGISEVSAKEFVHLFELDTYSDEKMSRRKLGLFGIIFEVIDWVDTAIDIYKIFTAEDEYEYEYEYDDVHINEDDSKNDGYIDEYVQQENRGTSSIYIIYIQDEKYQLITHRQCCVRLENYVRIMKLRSESVVYLTFHRVSFNDLKLVPY